ncbi:MAG: response regulator [Candidatus Omnitrophota bacterium]
MSEREREKDFFKRLLATFKIEAEDHVKAISSGLLELENSPGPERSAQILEVIYRQVHSLKGSARAVDFTAIESICQSLETIFKDFKSHGTPSSPEVFDILQRAIDTVEAIVSGNREEATITQVQQELEALKFGEIKEVPPKPAKETETAEPAQGGRFAKRDEETLKERQSHAEKPESEAKTETQPPQIQSPDMRPTIRIAPKKLDHILLQAEEMLFIKLAIGHRLKEMKEIIDILDGLKKNSAFAAPALKTLRTSIPGKEHQWKNLSEYMDDADQKCNALRFKVSRMKKSLQADHHVFGNMLNAHMQDIRKTLMLPFLSLTEGFPRMIRELSRYYKKEIELIIKGNDIEIDKRILEEMKIPLIHLLRNSADHGIELPDERRRKKKPAKGTIQINVTRMENNKVEITVSDDGQGINLDTIRANVAGSGMYNREEVAQLNEQELLTLIFNSEFTTSSIISELSGRGLGLAIVREKVEKLGGRITVESIPDQGTTFRILLQATLATSRGILVQAGGQTFIIPTLNVDQVVRVTPGEIKTIQHRESIKRGNILFSYVRLTDVLQIPSGKASDETEMAYAVLLGVGDRKIAFGVDRVVTEEEVLIKGLGKQLLRVKHISGAAVLWSGEVVLVLNVVDLFKSAIVGSSESLPPGKTQTRRIPTRQKNILLVEDSITSRVLLKNIFESAGYKVQTAVDGMEGWMRVKEKSFDLAVLDIEMPGLNGFELTRKIKHDRSLKHLPVVLVTALESRENREKGIDAGADAYIVKSSFDQSNLLDIIKNLIQ